MGFTHPGRYQRAALSSGEIRLLPSPPAPHLRTSRGFPMPVRALPLPHSLRIPVGEGPPKHSEL